jgi:hypothetical protein
LSGYGNRKDNLLVLCTDVTLQNKPTIVLNSVVLSPIKGQYSLRNMQHCNMSKVKRQLLFIVSPAVNNGGCIKIENQKSFKQRTKHTNTTLRKDARKYTWRQRTNNMLSSILE